MSLINLGHESAGTYTAGTPITTRKNGTRPIEETKNEKKDNNKNGGKKGSRKYVASEYAKASHSGSPSQDQCNMCYVGSCAEVFSDHGSSICLACQIRWHWRALTERLSGPLYIHHAFVLHSSELYCIASFLFAETRRK